MTDKIESTGDVELVKQSQSVLVRLEKEFAELHDKACHLHVFIQPENEKFMALSEEHRDLLIIQYRAMMEYMSILRRRIQLL